MGTVTGHVMCADTQRPARLATVKLVRVLTPDELKKVPASDTYGDTLPASNNVETGLDGAYTIRNVKPGTYYVVVDAPGYLLPLGGFSQKDLTAPDTATALRLSKTVHPIAVEGNGRANEDVVLERGASVSGTVSYDDGSPASGIPIEVLHKDEAGKWVAIKTGRYRSAYGFGSTDDYGHYRISGLAAAEYAVQANFSLNDQSTTSLPMLDHPGQTVEVVFTVTRFSLPVYSGDVLRKRDAVAYTLGTGEARAGEDLVFPLAKLHRVGGQVLARDGHAVNSAKVALLYADDKSEMTETNVQLADRSFALDFVPEGDFVLKVTNAADKTSTQVANAPGVTPKFYEETRTVKTYGEAEQALTGEGRRERRGHRRAGAQTRGQVNCCHAV